MRLAEINPFLRAALRLGHHSFVTGQSILACDNRLFYVTGGKGAISFTNITHRIIKGDLIIIGPAMPYLLVGDADSELELIILNYDYTTSNSHQVKPFRPVLSGFFDPGKVVEKVRFDDYEFLNEPFILHGMQQLEIDLYEIVHEFAEHKILYREKSSGIAKKLLFDAARAAVITHGKYSMNAPDLVNAVIDYMCQHYPDDSLNNAAICAVLNYHPYYINHLLKAYTGMSMHQYLTTLRMRAALELLVSTRNSIASIAANVGYKTQAHFSSCFKNNIGKSPLAYRQDFSGV